MPTTPFLLAAYAAARGSERLHAWLLAHAVMGPMIRDWNASGAVSRGAKWLATTMMVATAVILLILSPRWCWRRRQHDDGHGRTCYGCDPSRENRWIR